MPVPLTLLFLELLKEIRLRKWSFLLVFFVISFGVLIVGLIWKENYVSSVTIFVDDQNIIRPLMAGSAITTAVANTTSSAKEVIYSRKLLLKLINTTGIWPDSQNMSDRSKEEFIAHLRKKITVKGRGTRYFLISFSSNNPLVSFRVAQKLGQYFIEITEAKKKEESQSAYAFIDQQVKAYQQQLSVSGDKLKEFLSQNVDGTENSVNARVSQLQGQIEQAELNLKELRTQEISNKRQLEGVNKTIQIESADNEFKQKIDSLQAKLDQLRLSYHDSYPDIVSLKQQIKDLNAARLKSLKNQENNTTDNGNQGILLNPLYQKFRADLAATQTDIRTVITRINSLKILLKSEQKRMERIQDNKTKVAELTRDNVVNRKIYNDLLQKREQARVSMHLDIEGKGLSYQIHEPAEYPLHPTGLRFIHFVIAGLLLGLATPLGVIFGLLNIDPRVRYPELFKEKTGLPVLVAVNHFVTPFEIRRKRVERLLYILVSLLLLGAYLAISYLHLKEKLF
jgi:polysaccharide chain length determinant protein (PEP-CTERM system associated)